MRNKLIIISCLLASSQAATADDKEKTMFAASAQATQRWQQTHAAMQANDYQRSTRQNKRLVSHQLTTLSKAVLNETGAFAPAIGLLGASIDLALNDRRFGLNDSGSMGVLLRDSTSMNRSVVFEYRLAW